MVGEIYGHIRKAGGCPPKGLAAASLLRVSILVTQVPRWSPAQNSTINVNF